MQKKILVEPLSDRVVIVADVPDNVSGGGIIIPVDAQTAKYVATVVAVGPGKRDNFGELHPLELKVGDRVTYSQYGGSNVSLINDPVQYIVTKEENIVARLIEVEVEDK